MAKPVPPRGARVLATAIAALVALTGGAMQISRAAPSKSELKSAQDRLLALEKDFELVVEDYNAARERLEDIQVEIADKEAIVSALEKRMSGRTDDAVDLARNLYMGGSDAGMEAIVSSKSMAELDARLAYIETTEDANTELLTKLASDRSNLETQLVDLEAARAEAAETEAKLDDLSAEIEGKVASQKDEIEELNAKIEAAERRARRAARREAAEEAAAAAAAAEEAAAAPAPSSGGGGGAPAPVGPAPAANSRAGVAVQAALSQVGKPYQWGAAGPNSYDCSGLTMWAWAQAGVSLPHNSGMQYSATSRISQSQLQPGDLIFYGSPIHHVAMYIGNGQIVEAPYSGASVRTAGAFRSDVVGYGRV
jgi:peptidoglycan DL-endopeptidase CwlO